MMLDFLARMELGVQGPSSLGSWVFMGTVHSDMAKHRYEVISFRHRSSMHVTFVRRT